LLPFGLGAAVAVPLYNNFIDPANASFEHFLLFVGVVSVIEAPIVSGVLIFMTRPFLSRHSPFYVAS